MALPYTRRPMIRTFKNKALADLWSGRPSKIDARMANRIMMRLEALEEASQPQDMNIPGFDFHALKGHRPTRYTVHVNGPWCITFEFDKGDAWRVDYEQYH
jgi:proteic killer suppression protein